MGTKVKGLLRGLRYISQIFDEREPEMQIGYPTDVKHVAHIGWDGVSANKPSWMNKFKSSPGFSDGPLNYIEEVDLSRQLPLEDAILIEKRKHKSRRSASATPSPVSSPARKSTDGARRSTDGLKHSSRRHQKNSGSGSPLDSPLNPNAVTKHSRRPRSANVLMDSPNREKSSTTTGRSTRRQQQNSGAGPESPASDQLAIPRHSCVRKSKGSISNVSSRASRTKDQNSLADGLPFNKGVSGLDSEQGAKITANQLKLVLEKYAEEG